ASAPESAPTPELAPPAAEPAAAAPPPASPSPASGAAPVSAGPEEPATVAGGSLPELSSSAPPVASADEAPANDEDWYDAFDVRLFADAYFGWNFNAPKASAGQALTNGNDVLRAFDSANGFSLAWAGLDISHAAEPIGGALSLRFGPAARRYNSSCPGTCDAAYSLENVKQAYASWRPAGAGSKLSIDFGKFDTIYGAEVAESQDNINYTRGVLYWLGQPAFHTGFRVNAELSRNLTLRALAVNGWNNTVDNNTGKTFGLQATVHAAREETHDWIAASLGYLGGPEQNDVGQITCAAGSVFDASSASGCSAAPASGPSNTSGTVDRPSNNSKGWRHFIDFVVTADPLDALHLVLNADLGIEARRDAVLSTHFSSHRWLGGMLGARYLVVPAFAVAARGELYWDKDGITTGSVNNTPIQDATISTATLTLDYLPGKNLLVRLDNRLDHATREIFPHGLHSLEGDQFTTTLGVVVTTN
ncbi:MAG: outer membrane beta-barrel protein, partial [Pseudomonadota bacterium]